VDQHVEAGGRGHGGVGRASARGRVLDRSHQSIT
jgi:hypothetical protein